MSIRRQSEDDRYVVDGLRRGRLMREVTPDDWKTTRMGEFAAMAGLHLGRTFSTYRDLWSWSNRESDQFWTEIIRFFDLRISNLPNRVVSGTMPDATWMSGAQLNYAREALRATGDAPAVIGISQSRSDKVLSWGDLHEQVGSCRAGLQDLGVGRGDAVVAYMPNIPETVILFLASASLGAMFSSCPPEFGTRAVVDRLGQLEAKVLVASNGYVYGDRVSDRRQVIADLTGSLPGLQHVVLHEYVTLESGFAIPHPGVELCSWEQLMSQRAAVDFDDVEFDHPLYVLFSSGSTGKPKAIIHGHGGIALEHAKAIGLHNDVHAGDRFFWYSTTGWMVWNYGLSALLHQAALVCFDGNPGYPDGMELWRIADRVGATFFGTSAAYIQSCIAKALQPGRELQLQALREVASTGSPLPSAGFDWIDANVNGSVRISSVSGGTDVCSGFVGGSPLAATRAGELSAPFLGCSPVAFDLEGRSVVGAFGELCITAPMPSMPVGFVGDPDGHRLRETYFSRFHEVWTHGDWVLFFDDGSCVISGRSDSTLNRAGVRLGTADIYGVVDDIPGVEDSLVIFLESADGGNGKLLLLVLGNELTGVEREGIERTIRTELRDQLSPRHVPDAIEWVPGLPRTINGKRIETPIKKLLQGADSEAVVSRDSLTSAEDFEALVRWIRDYDSPRVY
jgi:acetoacetyl-CoA synthetase